MSAGFGLGGGLNAGLAFDNNGNIGVVQGYSYGAALPTLSLTGIISRSNASNIYKLSGESLIVGASGGEVAVMGIEVSVFEDHAEKNKINASVGVVGGIGIGIPVEIHTEIAESIVKGFNIYDIVIELCDIALQN